MKALPTPEPRRTADATLAQLRAWHRERFATERAGLPKPTYNELASEAARRIREEDSAVRRPPIIATGPTGQTILLDPDTGEVLR